MGRERYTRRELSPFDVVLLSRGLAKHYVAILCAGLVFTGGLFFDIGMLTWPVGWPYVFFGWLLGATGAGIAWAVGIPLAVIALIIYGWKGGGRGKI